MIDTIKNMNIIRKMSVLYCFYNLFQYKSINLLIFIDNWPWIRYKTVINDPFLVVFYRFIYRIVDKNGLIYPIYRTFLSTLDKWNIDSRSKRERSFIDIRRSLSMTQVIWRYNEFHSNMFYSQFLVFHNWATLFKHNSGFT